MRSLQVVTPHMECMFNCPFCISKAHPYTSHFEDNYDNNFELWKENFITLLRNNPDLGYVVITGTNEPMQSPQCVCDIADIVREHRPDIQIEIQTRYYGANEVFDKLDVVCYSISSPFYLDKIEPKGKISRYVLILTDAFNGETLESILAKTPKGVKQLTFKTLQNSLDHNTDIDEWIDKHRVDEETLAKLDEGVANYHGDISIRMDKTCMDATDRYKVFREDGQEYNNWDELPKEMPKVYVNNGNNKVINN